MVTNNVTKKQLYNTIHNTELQSDYNTEIAGGGYGKYGDRLQNSFRVDNLYTGGLSGNDSCQSDSMQNNKIRFLGVREL